MNYESFLDEDEAALLMCLEVLAEEGGGVVGLECPRV